MQIQEMDCVKACNHLSGKFRLPYAWDLNVYRGCAHGCVYCFARYTHRYVEGGDFFNQIFVKRNIVEALKKQMEHPKWPGQVVNLGGVTDNYQKAEESYQRMPGIWEVMIHHENPAIVSTKSDLILRDTMLIDALSRLTYVNVASTITCVDERIASLIEPHAVSSARRFAMLAHMRKTQASIGVHAMPIIPLITDGQELLEALFAKTKEIKADYLLCEPLNLRGSTKTSFFRFIKQCYPQYYAALQALYADGHLNRAYIEQLRRRLRGLYESYGLTSRFKLPNSGGIKKEIQPTLFDDYGNDM